MKKTALIIGIIIVGIASFIVISRIKKQTPAYAYTVGILQTASHPALDAAREGFMEELQHTMGDTIAFVIQNAQGSVAQAHAIAQQFHANKQLTGFFVIATPAAQAMSAVEKERPIFIAAVTDPQALGLLNPTTNVCGTKDMIDIKAEIEMLTQLIPHAKTIGLLYTSGETNSVALVKQMRAELETAGLTVLDFAVSNEADMAAMVELACRKSDVILTPTDNTVASSISLIVSMAHTYKKPLIVSDNMLVTFGALAARGIDYKESGKQAGRIAYKVLREGKKPYELPIEQATSEQIFINKKTVASLGLSIPQILQKHVILVEDKQ